MNTTDKSNNAKKLIIQTLSQRTSVKQQVYDHTFEAMNNFKKVLIELVAEYNKELKPIDNRLRFEFKSNNLFEAELKVASDLLLFNMHTNIFDFDHDHPIWKVDYVKNNYLSTYSGIINIYNFLTDSFRYNRENDLGYLIARIFINKDNYYFVEGKRQLGFLYNKFGTETLNKKNIRNIIESAILYALEFDLLVPPYDNMKIVSVSQMKERILSTAIQTGKRLGFRFYPDDDNIDITEK